MQKYYIYVLESKKTATRYVGSTMDIKKRVTEHNQGKQQYTKGRRPWVLLYSEEYNSRQEAMQRERFLKTTSGRRELDTIIDIEK